MFKPMLAGKCEDVKDLQYPVFVSNKLDGVRALVIGGVVMSRQLKPIPNAWVQKQYGGLPEGTDGELIYGDPTHVQAYRNTISAVMSEDGEPTEVHFHVFDNFLSPGGFAQRFRVAEATENLGIRGVIAVPHTLVSTTTELETLECAAVNAGHEGVMVRSMHGPYKQGRSTTKEGWLLKVKRFEDTEAVVTGTYEWETNNNEATRDALGHTTRSSHKENKVGAGVLGGLEVVGLEGTYKGVAFCVGTGFSGAEDPNGERGRLWAGRDQLVGRVAKVKYFPLGSKDKPRFPTFLGWRSDID